MKLKSIFALLLVYSCTTATGQPQQLLQPLNVNASDSLSTTYIAFPPKGWECIADPRQLPQKVKVIFVGQGNGNNQFTPSLNVACEDTSLALSEYIKQAKSYHEGRSDTRCSLIGKINTASGTAEVLQIDRPSQWGPIRFVQAIIVQEGNAYVVTATCLKNEFSALSPHLFKAIQSLTLPQKILRTNE